MRNTLSIPLISAKLAAWNIITSEANSTKNNYCNEVPVMGSNNVNYYFVT